MMSTLMRFFGFIGELWQAIVLGIRQGQADAAIEDYKEADAETEAKLKRRIEQLKRERGKWETLTEDQLADSLERRIRQLKETKK